MQKLLAFLIVKRHWILFILCEIVSFVLIYKNNTYQRSVMLSSANAVTGRMLSVSNTVFSYFDLININNELAKRNSELEGEIIKLKQLIENERINDIKFNAFFLKDSIASQENEYEFIPAGIVSNSTSYMSNYITINKGSDDGVQSGMGVVSQNGVAGIVMKVNNKFSVVISLLNVKWKVSCKVLNTNYFGALSWKGGDIRYAYLEELPTHSTFQIGDTIVTSGYSTVFPPGIMVGTVESYNKQRDDNFYSLKVRLETDFHSLSALSVINNKLQNAQQSIEEEAKKQ